MGEVAAAHFWAGSSPPMRKCTTASSFTATARVPGRYSCGRVTLSQIHQLGPSPAAAKRLPVSALTSSSSYMPAPATAAAAAAAAIG